MPEPGVPPWGTQPPLFHQRGRSNPRSALMGPNPPAVEFELRLAGLVSPRLRYQPEALVFAVEGGGRARRELTTSHKGAGRVSSYLGPPLAPPLAFRFPGLSKAAVALLYSRSLELRDTRSARTSDAPPLEPGALAAGPGRAEPQGRGEELLGPAPAHSTLGSLGRNCLPHIPSEVLAGPACSWAAESLGTEGCCPARIRPATADRKSSKHVFR